MIRPPIAIAAIAAPATGASGKPSSDSANANMTVRSLARSSVAEMDGLPGLTKRDMLCLRLPQPARERQMRRSDIG